jgi:hypothetical protein
MTTAWMAGRSGNVDLQATLRSATEGTQEAGEVGSHHPIACNSELRFEPDGTLVCEHAVAPVGDIRTQHCLNLSLAVLLMELAQRL